MMHERIDELIFQVGYTKLSYPDDNFLDGRYALTQEQLEKFAELIVRECIGCCEQVISDPVPESVDTFLQGGIHCIDEIKQHFGVEE